MLIFIPRSGVIGLLFSILPVMAGFSTGSLIGALAKPATTPASTRMPAAQPADANGAARPTPKPLPRQEPNVLLGLLCAGLPFVLFHAAAIAVYRKAMRDYTAEQSPGYWRAVFGGAYAVGLVMGLILVFST
jgi:hypothetical protein